MLDHPHSQPQASSSFNIYKHTSLQKNHISILSFLISGSEEFSRTVLVHYVVGHEDKSVDAMNLME